MDEREIGKLAARMFEKVCAVCPDRNVDGSCDRLAEGRCTLLAKLPAAAEAVLRVSSDRMEPYIEAIQAHVCAECKLRDPDGACSPRETDNCTLWCYLPLVVEAVEEYFGLPAAAGVTWKEGMALTR